MTACRHVGGSIVVMLSFSGFSSKENVVCILFGVLIWFHLLFSFTYALDSLCLA